jgi:RNA polymerase sigma factor (TIGR02999 family)
LENAPASDPERQGIGMSDVTRILNAIERGDRDPKREESRLGTHAKATDELLPLVYEELRVLAAQKLSHEAAGQTLQATALVHEAYLRLVGDEPQTWENRGHFFAAAAEAMRRILIENARRKKRLKHDDGREKVDLADADIAIDRAADDLLALDEALARLTQEDPVKAQLVKLRYFAGLTLEQAAEAMNISRATASRYWSYAQAWLFHEIHEGD